MIICISTINSCITGVTSSIVEADSIFGSFCCHRPPRHGSPRRSFVFCLPAVSFGPSPRRVCCQPSERKNAFPGFPPLRIWGVRKIPPGTLCGGCFGLSSLFSTWP
ncbi:unnamed protein product [Ectocarpus sp. 13 AM-2016]